MTMPTALDNGLRSPRFGRRRRSAPSECPAVFLDGACHEIREAADDDEKREPNEHPPAWSARPAGIFAIANRPKDEEEERSKADGEGGAKRE